jgi:tetratricopeptide (TPR) repeat protein
MLTPPRRLAAALLLFSSALAPAVVAAQTAPTKVAAPATPEQEEKIRAGVELHDKKQYDEAIARYQEVLKENADNMEALYELAYSYMEKKEFARSIEAARRGTEYKSDMLPMFYDMIATNYEEEGQLPQAVQTYRQALAVDPASGLLYHNLAITQHEKLKDPAAARQTLKEGIVAAPQFPGIPLLLGQWFEAEGYRSQAFLAVSRAVMLDNAIGVYALWRRIIKGPDNPMSADVMQDPDMRRTAAQNMKQPPAKLDEGDFTASDARFAAAQAGFLDAVDNDTPEIEALVAQVGTLIDAVTARPADAKTSAFVTRQWVPFFAELKAKDYVEPFVYWACARAPVPGVREWIKEHEASVRAFREWAVQYRFPTERPVPVAPAARK